MNMFGTIEQALEDLRQGKFIVVADDEDRENEGDLIGAAEFITPQGVNFLMQAKGMICVALSPERVKHLGLAMMGDENTDALRTAYTVTVDRDAAEVHEQFVDVGRDVDVDEPGVAAPLDVAHGADAVDVSLHDVAAEPVADRERAFEVEPGAHRPRADRRAIERRHDRGDAEPAVPVRAHREAGAIAGDALARRDPLVWRRDDEFAPGVRGGHLADLSNGSDQSREHAAADDGGISGRRERRWS